MLSLLNIGFELQNAASERVILVRVRLQIGGGSMGTREVYEQKLRTGNLYHDPTIKPGLGSPRCPRCLSLLNPISVPTRLQSLSPFACHFSMM